MVLSALGVPWETVVEDYLLSNHYRRAENDKMLAMVRSLASIQAGGEGEETAFQRVEGLLYVKEQSLRAAHAEILERHGSVEGYLVDGLGCSREDLARLKYLVVFVLAAACLLVAGTQSADADGKTVIRYATLAPSGSTFGKVLKAWSRSLQKETEGRVELRYYSGGSQGDERDFIRKMRAGQMDAAGVTSTGLGIIVRPVLVLSSPGLIREMPIH